MPEFRTSPDGGIEVRLAGSRAWKAVTPEEAEAYGMGRLERMGHSLGRGAESLIRGGVSVLDQLVGDPRGPMAPESAEDNSARLAELQRQSEAMGRIDPRAGLTAFAPEAVGAFVPGGLPAAIGTEAAIGAARTPDNPLLGAAIGGGLTAGVGIAPALLSAGARRGLQAGRAAVDAVRGETDLASRGARAADVANRRAGGQYRPPTDAGTSPNGGGVRDSMGAAANPDVPPGQRPLEGFLTADEAADVGIPLTRGDRMALDAADRETFDVAAARRSREELQRSSELGDALVTKIEETRQGQKAWLTSRIAGELGDPTATNLTPAARQRIRGETQDVFRKYFDEENTATLEDFDHSDLAKLKDTLDVATPNAEHEVKRQVDELVEFTEIAHDVANKSITKGSPEARDVPTWVFNKETHPQYLAEKRSEIASKAEKAFAAGNYELGSSLSQIREVVEDVLQRQYAGDNIAQEAIQNARKRWRILKALERNNAVDPAGDLNVRSFLNAYKAVTPRYKRLTKGGRGDLEAELETLNWLTTKVQPDSGTAQRLISMLAQPRAIGGGAAAAGAYGLGNALFGD